jgi:hypothetical protein
MTWRVVHNRKKKISIKFLTILESKKDKLKPRKEQTRRLKRKAKVKDNLKVSNRRSKRRLSKKEVLSKKAKEIDTPLFKIFILLISNMNCDNDKRVNSFMYLLY